VCAGGVEMTISRGKIPETVVIEWIGKSLIESCDINKNSHPTEGRHMIL
jgi:hypothetical protein